jgi:hypothetical protein
MNHLNWPFGRCFWDRFRRSFSSENRERPDEEVSSNDRAEDALGRVIRGHKEKWYRREGIGIRTLVVSLLTVLIGLLVGFVLFELAALLLSGQAAEAGVERILVHLALVCGGIALIMAMLRRESR